MDKERLREQIDRDVEDFLSAGGVIEIVPGVQVCPDSMAWAKARGYDYTPWAQHGGEDMFSNQIELDEGCYLTQPKQTED